MKADCSFYIANGRHCVLGDDCMVCHAKPQPDAPRLEKGQEIVLQNFGPLDGTYKIADVRHGKLRLEFVA